MQQTLEEFRRRVCGESVGKGPKKTSEWLLWRWAWMAG